MGVSGTECRRRSKGRGRRSEQSERGPFRALKRRPLRQVLLLARHASEDASGAAGGCPQSVESAVLRAFEDAFDVAGAVLRAFENASRAPGALFCRRMSQKTLRVPQEAVLRTEYLFRTGNACFLHRMPLKMRRVPEEAFLSTECVFRTVGGCFRYRISRTDTRCPV